MYLVIISVLIISGGKSYYSAGIYPVLIALGAYYFETIKNIIVRKIIRFSLVFILIVGIIPVLPISLHLYNPQKLEAHCNMLIDDLGLDSPMRWEDGNIHAIPQDFADMFGWEELASKVVGLYTKLPEDVKSDCFIYCSNYGEAGAIDYFGKKHGLPQAICFSDNYLLWTPDKISQKTGILVNADESKLSLYFDAYFISDSIIHKYARESGVKIYLVKNPNEAFHLVYENARN
jgi:hypothetical protein